MTDGMQIENTEHPQ